MLLGMSYVSGGQAGEAEKATQEVVTYSQEVGAGVIGALAYMFLGVVLISEGHMSQGSSILNDETRLTHESKSQVFKKGSLTDENRRE